MQNFKHVVDIEYKPTFRSEKVRGIFDLNIEKKLTRTWNVNIPLDEKDWSIGLIVGASGSGKTQLANKIFESAMHNGFKWKKSCLLDDFPENIEVNQITEVLTKVGFSSPPSWLLPYSALSNGQKFRCELARCLLEYNKLFVFDEFTSCVDRTVAQIGSFAFQKIIRSSNKKFVAVTCHYDVEPWLQPDWVFDVSTNEFKWWSLCRPKIEIEVRRVNKESWELFKNHHYLTGGISKTSINFCAFLNKKPIALSCWISHLGKASKNGHIYRAHRTVVLPDYQGLGIGGKLSDLIASMFLTLGYDPRSVLSHPSLIKQRIKSKNWKLISQKMETKNESFKGVNLKRSAGRLTASFKFVGDMMEKSQAISLKC